MRKSNEVLDSLKEFQLEIVDNVSNQMRKHTYGQLSKVAYEGFGDTIYAIDKKVENQLENFMEKFSRNIGPSVLVSEGIGVKLFGTNDKEKCKYLVAIDLIDGTRGIMYNINPAWSLAGVAPYKPDVSLKDIEVAVQTEIPTTNHYKHRILSAIKGQGATGTERNLFSGEAESFKPQPSRAKNLKGGFAMLTKFFEGSKTKTSEIEEELFRRLNLIEPGKAVTFDDQYISSGGQFARLNMGGYRFCGDIRPPFTQGLCAHPYDVCTKLISDENGVPITDMYGKPLDVPLEKEADVAWLGYANRDIQRQVEPVLLDILKEKVPNY